MPRLRDRVLCSFEVAYGWCGVCRSFTEFPHPCSGQDEPGDTQGAPPRISVSSGPLGRTPGPDHSQPS